MTLLYFTAPWCASCRNVTPLLAEFADARPDLPVTTHNVATPVGKELSVSLGVLSIPCLIVQGPQGNETARHTGAGAIAQALRGLQVAK